MICAHSYVITHCDITLDVPSNVITRCDVIMSGHCEVILIDLHLTGLIDLNLDNTYLYITKRP